MSLTGMRARQGGWNGNMFRSLEDGPTAIDSAIAAVHRLHGPGVPRLPLNRSDHG
jgi:hypothetical protein